MLAAWYKEDTMLNTMMLSEIKRSKLKHVQCWDDIECGIEMAEPDDTEGASEDSLEGIDEE